MKVAKAEKEEFDKVYDFINVMDSLFDTRFWSHEEDWKDWSDHDPNKKLLLKIEQEVKESDGEDIWNGVDNRLILYYFIKMKWQEANYCGSFQRIVTNADVLINNCCDPNLDYLEYNKDIQEALEKYNKEKE